MPNVTIWTGSALQYATADGPSWSLQKPHPPADRRAIQRANGAIRPVAIGNTGAWESILTEIDGASTGISLGYSDSAGVPNETKAWRKGYMLSARDVAARNQMSAPAYFQRPHSVLWRSTPSLDTSEVWLGLFVNAGATVVAAKARFFMGVVWKIGTVNRFHLVVGNGGFLAAGAGANAGAAIGIMTGFSSAAEMVNYTKFDYGLDVNIGKKWAEFAGACTRGAQLTTALTPAFKALSTMKSAVPVGQLLEVSKTWDGRAKAVESAAKIFGAPGVRGALAEASKSANTVEFAKTLLACLGVDGSSKGFDFIDLGGVSLELGVYGGYSTIHYAAPL
ncbi:hypothetical protein [Enterovirga sp. CN4-39]|uniref:hypothetical protein n=1 Tax=Enterovirga sp. CN4-39 TaxID=3400910 RepID=UPI003C0851AD